MPTGVGDNAGDNARKLLASPTNTESSKVKGMDGKGDSREAFTTTSSSRDKSMSTSRQGRCISSSFKSSTHIIVLDETFKRFLILNETQVNHVVIF